MGLALLQLLVEEVAGLGVSVVGLEAVKEELLVVGAGTSLDGTRVVRLLLDGGGSLVALRGPAPAHGTYGGANRLVGNGGTGSEGHSLGDGRSDAGQHAATAALLDGSGGRGGRWSGGTRGRRCRATGWGSRRGTTGSETSSTSASLRDPTTTITTSTTTRRKYGTKTTQQLEYTNRNPIKCLGHSDPIQSRRVVYSKDVDGSISYQKFKSIHPSQQHIHLRNNNNPGISNLRPF